MKPGSGVAAVVTPVSRSQAGQKQPRICHSNISSPVWGEYLQFHLKLGWRRFPFILEGRG